MWFKQRYLVTNQRLYAKRLHDKTIGWMWVLRWQKIKFIHWFIWVKLTTKERTIINYLLATKKTRFFPAQKQYWVEEVMENMKVAQTTFWYSRSTFSSTLWALSLWTNTDYLVLTSLETRLLSPFVMYVTNTNGISLKPILLWYPPRLKKRITYWKHSNYYLHFWR